MTIQVVNIGTAAGNRTGTVGRTAMADVVNNDIELYARSGVTATATTTRYDRALLKRSRVGADWILHGGMR